jgi:putative effector of murein hydrolase LrgA (UPF0299 family)
MKKSTKIFRTVLLVLVTLSFLMAGVMKLISNSTEVAMFAAVNLSSALMIIGALEVLVAMMLWWKKTRTFAILLGTAIMGAAVAETISIGAPGEIIAPGIVLLCTWAVFFIDHCGCCHCNCDACKNCMKKNKMETPTV